MSLLTNSWKYINEGNVHIVLQVVGTNHVIRLIKEDENTVVFKTIANSVNFINLVMIPLLANDNDTQQEIVHISTEEIVALTAKLLEFRPEKRRFKSILSSYAIKTANLTMLSPKCASYYCIEIKPKEGFMSSAFKRFKKCYYCMKQFLKLQENQIETRSNYCPLDLFSGNKNRMKQAIMSLVDNPQNNFRMFKDGNLVYHEKSAKHELDALVKNMNMFCHSNSNFFDFIVEMLLSKSEKTSTVLKYSEEFSTQMKKSECTEESNLGNDMFLYNLLKLQKLGKNLDFNINNTEGLHYVSEIIDKIESENIDLNTEYDREKFLTESDPKHLALIAAIAKDCSIMIAFSTEYELGFSTIKIAENNIPYRISVTDLEPKPDKTLAKRKKTEKKLIEIYEKHFQCESKSQRKY